MNDRLEAFNKLINKKRIAVLGIGVSNTPLIKQFLKAGAVVIACDRHTCEQLGIVSEELEAAGAILQLGDDYLNNLDADIIFRTPGMKYNMPQLEAARKKGIAVTSEMEVFFDLCPCKIFAVTGSDGKTTTTTIISEMFKKQGYTVHLGGNIGHPLLPDIEQINPQDMAVVELSSFQLISMRKSPDIAVVTNLSPNHLDMHKDMDEYINAKKNIFIHQNAFCRTVLNLDNAVTSSFADETRGQCYMFSRKAAVPYGSFLRDDGIICMNDGNIIHEIMCADEINIPGVHNIENYLAAISAVWGYVSPENMCSVAKAFTGVEHRIEFVKEIDGVKYYNDPIATTPTRTIAGLYSFNQKVILIAGGYDKHIPFAVLGPKVIEKVKILILLGKTAEKIEEAVKADSGYSPELLPIIKVTSLQEAVETAKKYATSGDIVMLSPACASFDMYKNFEERGKAFKKIVNLMHN
jgi:UDP-N-acetylmuramoylalanine--D-glutamate ligase